MSKITNQDRSAIRRIFDKTREDVRPLVIAKANEAGVTATREMIDFIAAQNALRVSMEVVFQRCLPYGEEFLAEMAARLASYSISAAPIERQQDILTAVVEALPGALETRLKSGSVIKTTWTTDGVAHPNMPEQGEVH